MIRETSVCCPKGYKLQYQLLFKYQMCAFLLLFFKPFFSLSCSFTLFSHIKASCFPEFLLLIALETVSGMCSEQCFKTFSILPRMRIWLKAQKYHVFLKLLKTLDPYLFPSLTVYKYGRCDSTSCRFAKLKPKYLLSGSCHLPCVSQSLCSRIGHISLFLISYLTI